jgi:hypothetical protein
VNQDPKPNWTIVFADEKAWVRFVGKLSVPSRTALVFAFKFIEVQGLELLGTTWLRSLGRSLYEFRIGPSTTSIRSFLGDSAAPVIPHTKMLIRIFSTFRFGKRILILNAYDKLKDTSSTRQQKEIERARKTLAAHVET